MSINYSYGAFLMMCSLTAVTSQVPQLTLTPSTAEAGDDVEMYCVFPDTSSAFTVSISDYETNSVIWQYISPGRTKSVGEAYRGRVQHTPQLSYSSGVTITLTNVTRDDEGWYRCVLEKTNQQALVGIGYLPMHVPPHSMRVFVTSPPPYIESQAVSYYPYVTPAYMVTCTFSVYPASPALLGSNVTIIRGDERKEVGYSSVQNGNVYTVTSSATFGLSRHDNGERTLSCEVTWRRGTDRERIYSSHLETPLNVIFVTPGVSTDGLSKTTFTPGETISAMCRAGSANPPHQIDWWIKRYINEGNETTYQPGEYNGRNAVSTLRVTAERWMDGEAVTCCLRDTDVCRRTHISVTSASSTSEPPNSTSSPTLAVPTMGSTNKMASTSVPSTSGMSTQAPTTTPLSNMSTTTTSTVPYSESTQVTKADLPVVDVDSLLLSHNSKTVTLTWATPNGDYDKITIQQCERGTDKCTRHDITSGVNGLVLKIQKDVEYEFFMLLYQAGDVVITAGPFVEQQEAQLTDPWTSGNAGAIAGGVVGGLVFILLIVAVAVLILKRRKAVLKSGEGTTSDVPVHVYENDGVLATTASQDDPPTSNAGEYEEIGEEAQSSRSNNVQHLYENQRHKENVEIESDYSGLGPREAPAPNVYDIISAYEN